MRFVTLVFAISLSLGAPLRAAEVIDGIAAQVGSEIVLVSEVLQAAAPAEIRILADGGNAGDLQVLHQEVLERMIERALIRQVVKRAELDATDPEVDQAIGDIARENQLSVEELHATVESQGMPFRFYRERIREEIEHRKVVSAMVASKVRIDDDEVRQIFDGEFADQPSSGEEFYLRQLLITPKSEGAAAMNVACMKLGAARARIVGGESFKTVAAEISEVNPEVGGAIGWTHERELAAWMRDAIGQLEPGDVSEVVEAPFGCNLIEVVERRPYEQITWERAKDPLTERVFEAKMGEEYKKFVGALRDQTYIERKGRFAGSVRLDPDLPGVGDF